MTPGIHLIHKPVGPTSFSLVRAAIEEAGRLKVCHGGTLDTFAHGLMLMLVGPATRLFDYLHGVPKVYEGTVRWGVETDNGDLLGRTVFEGDASGLTPEKLDEALNTFVGWREQTPPATSAKRVGGERAYLKAHRGEAVEMPASRVYLHEAVWLGHDLPRESRLRIVVRGGYYVRALVRDLGRMVGCGAHLTGLHRTAIGPWVDPGEGRTVEVHGREVMPWTASRMLSDAEVGELRAERTIAMGELARAEWALPAAFVEGARLVRGFHLGRMVYLLSEVEGRLGVLRELRGGV
ncbi:MAG: truB [Phycisphaerales bacterium]|nr:truB [Phycisphaerales bacterium]